MRLLLAFLLALPVFGALSTISDTLYSADGSTNVNGSMIISWPTFTTNSGAHVVPSGFVRAYVKRGVVVVDARGALIGLEPNDIADQANIFYTVKYDLSTGTPPLSVSFTETWVVPTSVTPLKLKDVRSIVSGGGSSSLPGVLSVNTNTGFVTLFTSTSPKTSTYPVTVADFKACALIPVASGTFTITLVASGSQPPNGQCVDILNYGSGVITIARSGQLINGAAANLTIAAGSVSAPNGLHIWSNGTNYFAEPNGGAGGGSGITALTGDATATGPGSAAITLATVNSGPGACGDSTHVCAVTTNGKGLVTAQAAVAISAAGGSVAWSDVSGVVVTGSAAKFLPLDGILFTAANSPAGTFLGQWGVDRATVPKKISSGTIALRTTAIASTACAVVVSSAATGVLTTDIISFTPNADITAVTGYAPVTTGGLAIYPYPTANFVNFVVCNPTSSSITPGAVSLNWIATR